MKKKEESTQETERRNKRGPNEKKREVRERAKENVEIC